MIGSHTFNLNYLFKPFINLNIIYNQVLIKLISPFNNYYFKTTTSTFHEYNILYDRSRTKIYKQSLLL